MLSVKNLVKRYSDDSFISRNVDILRGIAIILVVVAHVRNFNYYAGLYKDAPYMAVKYHNNMLVDPFSAGTAGVALFFFISGFLLDYLYRKNLKLKHYSVRRFSRIFPAWLLWTVLSVLAAYFAISYDFNGSSSIMNYAYGSAPNITSGEGLKTILLNLFFLGWFTQAWNSIVMGGWSIQVEVFNYVFFPALNKMNTRLMLIILVAFEAFFVFFMGNNDNPMRTALFAGPALFVLGLMGSRFIRRFAKGDKTEELNGFDTGLTVALVAVSAFMPFVTNYQWVSLLVIIISTLFAFWVAHKSLKIEETLKNIGKYSYGIFFSHWVFALPLSFFFFRLSQFMPSEFNYIVVPILTIVSVIMTLLFAYAVSGVLYKFYEKPIIKWAHKIK